MTQQWTDGAARPQRGSPRPEDSSRVKVVLQSLWHDLLIILGLFLRRQPLQLSGAQAEIGWGRRCSAKPRLWPRRISAHRPEL